jgi:hypothetical protein
VLQELGDLAGARTNYQRALRVFEATYGPGHPSTRTVADNLRRLKGRRWWKWSSTKHR